MKNFNQIIIILAFLLITLTGFSGCTYINQYLKIGNESKSPVEVYHKAWEIIHDNFYDEEYNGEDWNYWKNRYDNVIKTPEDSYVAIQSMIESLGDRYTRLLTPEEFYDQDSDIEAKISGIGIQIAQKDNDIMIVSILEETPAYDVDLEAKDIIIAVNDISTKGMDLRQVASLIRGEIGTFVKLTILRENKKKNIKVKRDEIKIKAVTQKLIDKKINYIRLSSFISQNAGYEMEDAVLNSPDAKAIILDLRNNYGGLLPNAISIANIFIDKGSIIVSIVNKKGKKEDLKAIATSITDKPLIVIINGASASASEILGGALKDHHRAILVGEKTFGKGMVQKIFNLPDGSGINVTVSKYLTPNGKDINKIGIEPDVEVTYTLDDFRKGKDIQLDEAIKIANQAIEEKKKLTASK